MLFINDKQQSMRAKLVRIKQKTCFRHLANRKACVQFGSTAGARVDGRFASHAVDV